MPYKCTQCGAVYMDGSEELQMVVKRGGCACGKKLLMYVRAPAEEIEEEIKRAIEEKKREKEEKVKEEKVKEEKVKEEKVKEEKEVKKKKQELEKNKPEKVKSNSDLEWLDKEFTDKEREDKHVYFDVETVQRIEEGKFKLDVGSLMSGKPYVVKAEEGVYYIHVPSAMKKKIKKEK